VLLDTHSDLVLFHVLRTQALPGSNTSQQRFLRYKWCTAWCTIIPVLVLLLCFAVALHSLISSPLFLIAAYGAALYLSSTRLPYVVHGRANETRVSSRASRSGDIP
jgi:hypothetical protein